MSYRVKYEIVSGVGLAPWTAFRPEETLHFYISACGVLGASRRPGSRLLVAMGFD